MKESPLYLLCDGRVPSVGRREKDVHRVHVKKGMKEKLSGNVVVRLISHEKLSPFEFQASRSPGVYQRRGTISIIEARKDRNPL
jgi:hypothetical protein